MRTIFSCLRNIGCWLMLLLLTIQISSPAQKKESFYRDSLFAKYADNAMRQYDAAQAYHVINSSSKLPASLKILRQLSSNTAIVFIASKQQFESLQVANKIAPATNNWKLSPAAERLLQTKPGIIQKIIIAAANVDSLQQLMKASFAATKLLSVNRPSNSLLIACTPDFVRQHLLPQKEIIFIDVAAAAHAETGIIGYDRSFHGISTLDYQLPGANGKGIVVGVKEQLMDAADIDLHKRVVSSPVAAATTNYHATVIASLIGGAGNSFYDARGIANGCSFFPSSFSNLFADDAALLTERRVTVQNHSYGTLVQQFYGAEAVSYDDLVWNHPGIVPVFSSGNQGTAAALEGAYMNLPGYANLTGNFKMAKNVITVGAVDNSGNLVAESSSGPLYDGRLAPQLVALGPNGTSDAAAIVSGTAAVMQQVYADSNGQAIAPASLIKAILYNTADDISTPGIDYKTGYGMLNSYAAVKAVQNKKYANGSVSQNETWTTNITVPANTAHIKITLTWTDSAASLNNYKALTNNLDLEVKELSSGTVYLPWVLNSNANKDSLALLPVRKNDSLNTTEQVSVQEPAAGIYEVKVIGAGVPFGTVPFYVVYTIDSLNTFSFTSPAHASDIALAANGITSIRWQTFVADSNASGNLFVSYNNPDNWQLLQNDVKLANKKYEWTIRDTNTVAQLKMETDFGSFFSSRFVMARITKPVVDFVCTDSFRISWNRHVYASGYTIYMLTDSPYLQPVLTVTDSFVVLQRQQYPAKVYAIQPLLSNSLPAARSVAIDIEQQGVQCFYKTLNYDLLDNNKLKLLLELSITALVDSVAFEKVTAAGNLLQNFGGSKVSTGQSIYSLITEDVTAGTTYLRGRIRLKNGVMLYTNIVPVLTSGKNSIVFYPNPASVKNKLRYVLKQGIPTDTRLQFFNVSGRLLKIYTSLPDNIDLSNFSPGMVFYKLLSATNEILQTGKLVIY